MTEQREKILSQCLEKWLLKSGADNIDGQSLTYSVDQHENLTYSINDQPLVVFYPAVFQDEKGQMRADQRYKEY